MSTPVKIIVYLPQVHTFITTVWLWSTDEYVFLILSESPSLNADYIVAYKYT